MHTHRLRISLRTQFTPAILEVPHQLLLLRVDRNHRLPRGQATLDFQIDVLKLCVAVRATVALFGLSIGLQAVAQLSTNAGLAAFFLRDRNSVEPLLQPRIVQRQRMSDRIHTVLPG